jgi:hypothetical protein
MWKSWLSLVEHHLDKYKIQKIVKREPRNRAITRTMETLEDKSFIHSSNHMLVQATLMAFVVIAASMPSHAITCWCKLGPSPYLQINELHILKTMFAHIVYFLFVPWLVLEFVVGPLRIYFLNFASLTFSNISRTYFVMDPTYMVFLTLYPFWPDLTTVDSCWL